MSTPKASWPSGCRPVRRYASPATSEMRHGPTSPPEAYLEGDQPTSFERLRSPANLIKGKSHGIRQFLEANTAVDATVLVNPACDFAQDREVTARPDVVQLRRAHGRLSEIGAEAGRQPLSSHDWGLRGPEACEQPLVCQKSEDVARIV